MSPAERCYVLLRHECPADYRDGPHWDLMIEEGDALRTWSLLELPQLWANLFEVVPSRSRLDSTTPSRDREGANRSTSATELPPHRLAYLDYEGEVSGGRGHVARSARGVFDITASDAKSFVVKATTGELAGVWRLTKLDNAWRLTVESVHAAARSD